MKERCKDLIHQRVRLTRELVTNGGDVYKVGHEFIVMGSWRGLFTLGTAMRSGQRVDIRKVRRSTFEVLGPAKVEIV